MAGEIGPANRDADAEIAFGQRPDRMPSDEAGPAKDRDQGIDVGRHFPAEAPSDDDASRYAKGGFLYSGDFLGQL
jgi:hypothetical protein